MSVLIIDYLDSGTLGSADAVSCGDDEAVRYDAARTVTSLEERNEELGIGEAGNGLLRVFFGDDGICSVAGKYDGRSGRYEFDCGAHGHGEGSRCNIFADWKYCWKLLLVWLLYSKVLGLCKIVRC